MPSTLPSKRASITAERDEDEDDAPKTRRHLGIDELFVQLKHYNATVRKDAIAGLKELFKAHPELLQSHITQTLRFCAPLVADDESTVRKALLSLLSWLFETVPTDKIRPHAPTLLLFVTSAQTHIFPEIRVDGVRFLDALLASVPDVVTRAWADESSPSSSSAADGRRVLSGYLALLNASSTSSDSKDANAPSTSGAVLSPASRLLVLRSLSTFLRNALETGTSSSRTPVWFLSSSFSNQQAFDAFTQVLGNSKTSTPAVTIWTPEYDESSSFDFVADAGGDAWSFAHIVDSVTAAVALQSSAAGSSTGASATSTIRTADLAHTLQPILTAAFLDGAPSLQAVTSRMSSAAQLDIDTVVAVADVVRTLYVAIFSGASLPATNLNVACNDLRSVLSYMDPHFPFHVASNYDHQMAHAVQRLNLTYCELTGLYALVQSTMTTNATSSNRGRRGAKSKTPRKQTSTTSAQMERIANFIIDLLDMGKVSQPIQADAYRSLLPSIWSLLNADSDPSGSGEALQQRVLAATVQHAIQTQSTGAVKPLATVFVAQLLLLQYEPQYCGAFRIPVTLTKELERWLQELPKLCWELGNSHLPLTETIFTFLLRLVQRAQLPPPVLASLRSRLCPYFMISHATRGKLQGPFAKLQTAGSTRGAGKLSRLALDLAVTLAHGEDAQEELRTAVQWATATTEESAFVL
ncbi:hypothetical protein EXIGLDRAFT_746377 [Exidia glandulosa HHB12029]|uniref:Pre-rRNA-processing protein n=1 Tax=Exidia glandulosa HHB12029 TaxID=1314781 RepID=A0A165MCC8_EXIGL|nr:hypothetical protein EXIGLDRAFT_746377 [Exidia glandulosa HHB12029]